MRCGWGMDEVWMGHGWGMDGVWMRCGWGVSGRLEIRWSDL